MKEISIVIHKLYIKLSSKHDFRKFKHGAIQRLRLILDFLLFNLILRFR